MEEEGWRFDGWFDGETKIQAGSYTLTKNLALSAKIMYEGGLRYFVLEVTHGSANDIRILHDYITG